MTKTIKSAKDLKYGQTVLYHGDLAVVVEKPWDVNSIFESYWRSEILTFNGVYRTIRDEDNIDALSPTKRVVVFKVTERSDDYVFYVLGHGKKRTVVGGCRTHHDIQSALDYWHDDYRLDEAGGYSFTEAEAIEWRETRLALNRESRQIVKKLAKRVDEKLGKQKESALASKKSAKKKRKK